MLSKFNKECITYSNKFVLTETTHSSFL